MLLWLLLVLCKKVAGSVVVAMVAILMMIVMPKVCFLIEGP